MARLGPRNALHAADWFPATAFARTSLGLIAYASANPLALAHAHEPVLVDYAVSMGGLLSARGLRLPRRSPPQPWLSVAGLLSACSSSSHAPYDSTGETGPPPCGDYSVDPGNIDGIPLVSVGSHELVIRWLEVASAPPGVVPLFGLAGPLNQDAGVWTAESCNFPEPPAETPVVPLSCRPFPQSGDLVLATNADPLDYDPADSTVFGASVADQLTYVFVIPETESCVVFGRDTCIYESMGCSQVFDYAD